MGSVMTSRQAAELDHAMERNGWTAEHVKRLSVGDLLARLLPVVEGTVALATKVVNFITHTFTIMVDETMSVEELVKAGKFNWSNENIISKNFPKPKGGEKGEKEVTIFHFKKFISSENAIKKMNEDGYKPATIWDLLGLAIKQPDLQREFPIIALGSVAELDGRRHVGYLDRRDSHRDVNLDFFDGGWRGHCRFLAVRN